MVDSSTSDLTKGSSADLRSVNGNQQVSSQVFIHQEHNRLGSDEKKKAKDMIRNSLFKHADKREHSSTTEFQP